MTAALTRGRALYESGKKVTEKVRDIMPELLQRARAGKGHEITYGEINPKGPMAARFVAAKIGEICRCLRVDLAEPDLPCLNAIIVNKGTRLPSSGVEPFVTASLRSSARHPSALRTQARDAVWDYGKRWQAVAAALGITIGRA